MNRYIASLFQAPDPLPVRDPSALAVVAVCPHCKIPVIFHRFFAKDGYPVETAHCYAHGDVIAIRSHIHNTDWSEA